MATMPAFRHSCTAVVSHSGPRKIAHTGDGRWKRKLHNLLQRAAGEAALLSPPRNRPSENRPEKERKIVPGSLTNHVGPAHFCITERGSVPPLLF